jgi:hypothetical protein
MLLSQTVGAGFVGWGDVAHPITSGASSASGLILAQGIFSRAIGV